MIVHNAMIGRSCYGIMGGTELPEEGRKGGAGSVKHNLIWVLAGLISTVGGASVYASNVLVLTGNFSQAEFPILETFTDVDGEKVTYSQTNDTALPDLDSADILWIGQGEICENGYFFSAETEDKIKNFVRSGGIVISIGQDSDDGDPCEVGWITAPIVGVESPDMSTFEITDAPEVGDLFEKPNRIETAEFDDAWTEPDHAYTILATVNNGQEVGIALLKHDMGYYILTSIENENASQAATNTPIMENLIHYAVRLKGTIAVECPEKLSVRWGKVKSAY